MLSPNSISFFVPGIPIATQYRQTKNGVLYKSSKGKQWEKTVSQAAMVAMNEYALRTNGNRNPWEGAVGLLLLFWFPIAASRKELRHGFVHLQDPDATNLLKNTEDGLKRILFLDDNAVQIEGVYKYWCHPKLCGVNVKVTLYDPYQSIPTR